jgi:DNA-binding transcriptional LysR family regulator
MQGGFRDRSGVRVLLAVMPAGSGLAAATVLGLSQPTVARSHGVLDHDPGLTLFVCDTQGCHAAPEAEALLAEADAPEADAAGRARKAGQLAAARSRRIRPISFMNAAAAFMTPVVEEYLGTHPGVACDLIPTDRRLDLAAVEADMALCRANRIADLSLICRQVRGMSVFASRACAERRTLPRTGDGLAGQSFIVRDDTSGLWAVDPWLRSRILPGQIAMRYADLKGVEAVGLSARITLDGAPFVRCFDVPDDLSPKLWLAISPSLGAGPRSGPSPPSSYRVTGRCSHRPDTREGGA